MGVLCVLFNAPAPAQSMQVAADPESPALRCLTPARDTMRELEYPREAWVNRLGGRVALELEFFKPDAAPNVLVKESIGDSVFEVTVKRFVAHYRVPCMAAGEAPVRLQQEFVFVPDERRIVQWFAPADAKAAQRNLQVSRCLTAPSEAPEYPDRAPRRDESGTVLLRVSFLDGPTASGVEVLFEPGSRLLAETAREHAVKYRLPCFVEGPVEAVVAYAFRLEGAGRIRFENTDLKTPVAAAANLSQHPASFDFGTMGCPFDVRFGLRQPALPNQIGEVGASDPARRPFLEWLSRLSLRTTQRQLKELIGQAMTVSVPCGKLQL